MYKIGIIGPKTSFKTKELKDFLFKVKSTFGTTALIFSGGNEQGIEREVKKYSLEMGFNYKEFNPSYTGHNLYSYLDESYFGKNYHWSQLQHRYDEMLYRIDRLIIFKQEDDKEWKMYEQIYKKALKKNIKTMLI